VMLGSQIQAIWTDETVRSGEVQMDTIV